MNSLKSMLLFIVLFCSAHALKKSSIWNDFPNFNRMDTDTNLFGEDKEFKDSDYCRDMVRQYFCLSYGSYNKQYQKECSLKNSSPTPCRRFCSQMARQCANNRHHSLLKCQDIECPVESGIGCGSFYSTTFTALNHDDPALHFSVSLELKDVASAKQTTKKSPLDSAVKSTVCEAVAQILAIDPSFVSWNSFTSSSTAAFTDFSVSLSVMVPNPHHLNPPPMELYTSMSVALTAAVGDKGDLVRRIDAVKGKYGADFSAASSSLLAISEASFYSPCVSSAGEQELQLNTLGKSPIDSILSSTSVDKWRMESFIGVTVGVTVWCLLLFLFVWFVQRATWLRYSKSSVVGATVADVDDNSNDS